MSSSAEAPMFGPAPRRVSDTGTSCRSRRVYNTTRNIPSLLPVQQRAPKLRRVSPQLTRPEAVTLALYALGGADASFETEDVAIRVAEIAPGMFAWQKYPERID